MEGKYKVGKKKNRVNGDGKGFRIGGGRGKREEKRRKAGSWGRAEK